MTSVRLSEEMERKLDRLALATKRTRSFYIKEAVSRYIDDLSDLYIALERISDPNREFLSTKEVLQHLRVNKNVQGNLG